MTTTSSSSQVSNRARLATRRARDLPYRRLAAAAGRRDLEWRDLLWPRMRVIKDLWRELQHAPRPLNLEGRKSHPGSPRALVR